MKKRGSLLVLTSLACTMLLASCGGASNIEANTYELSIEKDNGVSTVQILDGETEVSDLTRIEEGTELKVVITLNDGYETTAVTLNDDAISATDGSYLFEMPSEDATLSITTEQVSGLVTVNNDSEKGTYTLKAGEETLTDNRYEIGVDLTLSVTANEGYELASVKVDGTDVELTDGSYTFKASKATYTIDITYNELYKVSLEVLNEPSTGFYGSVKVFAGDLEITSDDYLKSGTDIRVVLTAAENRTFTVNEYMNTLALLYLHVNDDVYMGDDTSVATLSSDNTTLTFALKVENEDLDIKVAYNSSTIFNSTTDGAQFKFADNENISVYAYSENERYDSSYFTPIIVRKPGYKVTSITLTNEDGETEELNDAYSLPMFKNNVSQYFSISSSLSGNITVTFDGELTTERKITYVGLDSVKSASGLVFDESLVAGDTVQMGNIVSADPNKYIKDIKITGVEGVLPTQSSYDLSWSYSFTMPESDVTIEFVLDDAQTLGYTENENIESVVFRSSSSFYNDSNIITSGIPGQTVYAFITVKDGYLLSKVVDQDGLELTISYTYDGTPYVQAIVGDNGLELTFTLGQAYNVTVDPESSEYISTNLRSGEQAAEGSTYEFTFNLLNYSKTVKSVYLTNTNGDRLDVAINVSNEGYYTVYSFTMPANDVIICYELEDAKGYTTNINVTTSAGEDLSTVLKSFMLSNGYSDVQIEEYKEGLTADLYADTDTQIQLELAAGYEATATYTYTDGGVDKTEDVEISYAGGGSVLFKTFVTPAGIKSIDIVISKATPVSATVTHDDSLTDAEFSGLDISYFVNDEEVSTFTNNVYYGDYINLTINSEAENGYVYEFSVKDSNGIDIYGSPYYGYEITGAFTVTISKVKAYSFSVVSTATDSYSIGLETSNGDYLADGDLIYGDGLTGCVYFYYCYTPLDYEIKVGETVVDSGSITTGDYPGVYSGMSKTFTINGNVVVTIKDHVAA